MSYCRWSTDIKNTVPFEEMFWLMRNGVKYDFMQKLRHRRHGELSDWYIFDHIYGGIAFYHKRDNSCPIIDYEDVLYMHETKDYGLLPIMTQQDFFESVLEDIVQDIKDEHK